MSSNLQSTTSTTAVHADATKKMNGGHIVDILLCRIFRTNYKFQKETKETSKFWQKKENENEGFVVVFRG